MSGGRADAEPFGTERGRPVMQRSLPALAAALRSGEVSVERHLDELETAFEAREPSLHAFLPEADRFARLRREAAELERRFRDPELRPPLFGVPVGVKDIFHVDGFITRAGTRVPSEFLQGVEAESVTRLRNAGALILGKTVTTEFAYFAPGPTRNPHHPAHTPGGSSSGSAAAVGAGLCLLALGTQTIGSINRPASFCGVVGFKPTFGRVSRQGVIALSESFDHVGFFAADAGGAQHVARVLLRDWHDDERPAAVLPVLGLPAGPYLERASREMLDRLEAVCGRLRESGYTIKSVPTMSDFDAILARHYLIVDAEAARAHREWFPRFRELYHEKTVKKLERGRGISDASLMTARRERDAFVAAMNRQMSEHEIDLWLSPSAVGAAPAGLEQTGDPVMSLPWSQLGFPSLTLPAGRGTNGLPLGIQLSAARERDESLMNWARAIESVLNTWMSRRL